MTVNMFTTSTKTFFIMIVMDIQKPQIKSFDYKLVRHINAHKNYKEFHKVIILVNSPSERNVSLFYSQYFFRDVEHDVYFTPTFHGTTARKDKFSSVGEDARSSSFNGMTANFP